MAMTIKDYEVEKYKHWMAETERNLPSLIKKHLLVMVTSNSQNHEEVVCISRCLLTCNSHSVLYKTDKVAFLIISN